MVIREKKPMMDQSAPWSSRKRRGDTEVSGAARAVVYVVGIEGGSDSKIGVTGNLKQRLSQLQDDVRCELHIHFWVELTRKQALSVEGQAKRALRSVYQQDRLSEWFPASAEQIARCILDIMAQNGIRAKFMAGFPGAVDAGKSDLEEVIGEPLPIIDKHGRQSRELWSPQWRNFSD